LLHPVVSGNKWYKLRLNLAHAADNGYKTIVTFGGGYSNHLVATAFAAHKFGLQSVGIVRGRHDRLTPTLEACQAYGMVLQFVTHEDYSLKHQPGWAEELVAHFDECFIIPEGGDNALGRSGAGLINRFINHKYSHIAVSVGTGTTLVGLRNVLPAHQQVLGFVPMKGGNYMYEHIGAHLAPGKETNWRLYDQWHFGGFGKCNTELIAFMNSFYTDTKVPLDMVYTAKMMFGIRELLQQHEFTVSDRLLCIHTGGLQGNASIKDQLVY